MKVCLLTLFVGSAFICQETLAASCLSCCTTPSDFLFCTFSEDGKNCSGGCECCPSESQIGKGPDDRYFCCQGEKPQVTLLLNKEGYSMCCATGQTAYQTPDDNSECCDGMVSEVLGRSDVYHCCPNDQIPYWNGSSVACCPTANALVTNYKNGVGEAGYTCCQVKEDYESSYEDEWLGSSSQETSSNWTVVGGINGSCCGGYTSGFRKYQEGPNYWETESGTLSRTIRQNGGVYYCAIEYINRLESQSGSNSSSLTTHQFYPSDSKFCTQWNGGNNGENCQCSDSGDPKNGSNC